MMEGASLRTFLAVSVALHLAGAYALVRLRASLAHSVAPTASPASNGLGGDTFDVPEEIPLPLSPASEPDLAGEGAPASPARAPTGSHHAHVGAAAAALPPAVYGADGARDAVDVATAFTRGFPQAASTDPAWARAPFGPAGEADVAIEIDDDGKLVALGVEGHPSSELRAGISRTLALIRGRTFTARAPRTLLHVKATVSPDVVHDGLHGDVFAIGGSFTGGEGSAFFALAIGRRVDLSVRAR